MRGTGKSTLLARWAAKFPRRLIFDVSTEFYGKYPGAYECLTYKDTLDALEEVAARPNWVLVTCLLPKEYAKVLGLLAPLHNPRAGYSRAVGGVLVECGEVETIAPVHRGIDPAVENVFHRGRHSLTSLAVATRRPANVNKIVTSQLDALACFRQHEKNDVEYLASVIGETHAARLLSLNVYPHGGTDHLLCLPMQGYAAIVNDTGAIVEKL